MGQHGICDARIDGGGGLHVEVDWTRQGFGGRDSGGEEASGEGAEGTGRETHSLWRVWLTTIS